MCATSSDAVVNASAIGSPTVRRLTMSGTWSMQVVSRESRAYPIGTATRASASKDSRRKPSAALQSLSKAQLSRAKTDSPQTRNRQRRDETYPLTAVPTGRVVKVSRFLTSSRANSVNQPIVKAIAEVPFEFTLKAGAISPRVTLRQSWEKGRYVRRRKPEPNQPTPSAFRLQGLGHARLVVRALRRAHGFVSSENVMISIRQRRS